MKDSYGTYDGRRPEPPYETAGDHDKHGELLARIDAALERIKSGQGLMRVPADMTDPDLVLAECRKVLSSRSAIDSTDHFTFDDWWEQQDYDLPFFYACREAWQTALAEGNRRAREALKDIPDAEQQLRNIAAAMRDDERPGE